MIYFPLVLGASAMFGFQATITPGNLSSVLALSPDSIQMDNLRVYEPWTWDAYRETAQMIAFHRPMVILWFTPETTNDDLSAFCQWVGENLPANVIQIGQEPDLPTGTPGYYGGWGMPKLDRYVEQYHICREAIMMSGSMAKIIIGVSTAAGWDTWLSVFLERAQLPDAIGLHFYDNWPSELRADVLRQRIRVAQQFGIPVWMTELGYGYVGYHNPPDEFYKRQADWIEQAFTLALEEGAERIYYYGYNPGWMHVDLKKNALAQSVYMRFTKGE